MQFESFLEYVLAEVKQCSLSFSSSRLQVPACFVVVSAMETHADTSSEKFPDFCPEFS